MKIKFWGVRGSLPTPLSAKQIQAKITAVVQRIEEKDIASQDSREKFVASLPEWIFGTVGGNTACVELRDEKNTEIILDAGSGLAALGRTKDLPKDNSYNLILSHLHWDHVQGIPFFGPFFNPKAKVNVYGVHENLKEAFIKQMSLPFSPITLDSFTKDFTFHQLEQNQKFNLGNLEIAFCKMAHPGDSYSFAFTENGKKFVYATDVELYQKNFTPSDETEAVFRNADSIILDAQYTIEEAYKKLNWGHSSFCYGIDFAVFWGIKKVYLFHHEPAYDDKKLDSILEAARWYAKYIIHSDIEIYLAVEGQEIEI